MDLRGLSVFVCEALATMKLVCMMQALHPRLSCQSRTNWLAKSATPQFLRGCFDPATHAKVVNIFGTGDIAVQSVRSFGAWFDCCCAAEVRCTYDGIVKLVGSFSWSGRYPIG